MKGVVEWKYKVKEKKSNLKFLRASFYMDDSVKSFKIIE